MITGLQYYLYTLCLFTGVWGIFLWLRYGYRDLFVRWHFILWAPFTITVLYSIVYLFSLMASKSQWDMGPAIALVFIGPYLLALIVTLIFRPRIESFHKWAFLITAALYALYLAGFYFVVTFYD